jgi:hypothetical protein
MNTEDKCDRCGLNDAMPLHECPKGAEVYDDHELCNCCEDCENNCRMDI